MPKFDLTLEIARPPAEVFAYLTDISKLPEWQTSARSAELEGELGEGATIRERRSFLGRDVTTQLRVVTYDPPHRFDVTSRAGPATLAIRHRVEPRGEGTRLDVEIDVQIGGMMRFAAQGPLKLAEREFRDDFRRLKAILDGTS